jgi:hypothetical protein
MANLFFCILNHRQRGSGKAAEGGTVERRVAEHRGGWILGEQNGTVLKKNTAKPYQQPEELLESNIGRL